VVQIIGITDVPWMDLLSPSDCFVRLDVIDGTTGRRYDCCARTLTLEDTIAPTWGRAFLALPLSSDPAAGDLVRIQIWDEDLPKRAEFADDLIAEGTLPLSALADGDTHTFTLTMLTKQMRGLPAGATASTATLRLVTPTASPAQASADALSAPSAPLPHVKTLPGGNAAAAAPAAAPAAASAAAAAPAAAAGWPESAEIAMLCCCPQATSTMMTPSRPRTGRKALEFMRVPCPS
jgi:hypothetical protein